MFLHSIFSISHNSQIYRQSPTPSLSPPQAAPSVAPAPSPPTLQSKNASFQPRPSNLNPGSVVISTNTLTPSPQQQRPISQNINTLSRASSDISRSGFVQNPFPAPPRLQSQSSPMTTLTNQSKPLQPSFSTPNYNIYSSIPNTTTTTSTLPPTMNPSMPLMPQQFGSNPSTQPMQPHMGGLLTPSKPAQTSTRKLNTLTKDDWGDFDPLS